MSRLPKPWFRKDRNAWYVTINGLRHKLGKNKKQAFDQFYKLMRAPTSVAVSGESFIVLADAFLDWVKVNLAPDTFEWYRYRLERFCARYPSLRSSEIRPFHVQTWVDSYPHLSKTSRHNYVRCVKRCSKWGKQQGLLEFDTLSTMACPAAESKDITVTPAEFDCLRDHLVNAEFEKLCRVTFETGCRPQEILRVEARHFDSKNLRWVLSASESKGKKKPRIVYLTPYAIEVTKDLAERFPTGKLFRNTKGIAWTKDSVNCAFEQARIRMGKTAIRDQGLDEDAIAQEKFTNGKPIKEFPERERVKIRNKVRASFAPKYSLYAFRHSWATRALQSGLDALTVAVLMGHNDPSTLSRVYQHLSHNPELLRKQVESVSG